MPDEREETPEATADRMKGGTGRETETEKGTETDGIRIAFRASVTEGVGRLSRSLPSLLATGLMGGLDVSLGVLALLVVLHATGSTIAASFAFTIGFLALTLGKSELFTENFLVPVATVAARKASVRLLLRLWGGTLVTNLIGGWTFAYLIAVGLPQVGTDAVGLGQVFVDLPFGQATALGIMGGASITLMTWMQQGAESGIGRISAVVAIAFLLTAAHLNHVIVVSIEIFVALHSGQAPYGYLDWLRVASWAMVTNMIGGLLLVTLLRLVQVGRRQLEEARASGMPTAENRKEEEEKKSR